MATTKAVILARGLGSRMRTADADAVLNDGQARVADQGLKAMIPVGRPLLDHSLHMLADAGITDVCLVIGPEHGAVRAYYAQQHLSRVRLHFAEQREPRGTSDAVASAERFADGDVVLVMNGDNYYPLDAVRTVAAVQASAVVGFSADGLVAHSNIPAARIRQFALLQSSDDGTLATLVEKPDAATYALLAPHALVSMNLWSFSPVIYEACRQVTPSVRGELELQDAVRIAMTALGERFVVVPSDAGVLDLSTRGDVAAVTAALASCEVRL
jgi:dTDP-glucose pyrophosphorylase